MTTNGDNSVSPGNPLFQRQAPEHPEPLLILDTTLRDGEQSPGVTLTAEDKLAIAHQLARLRVDIIEAGFPYSSPGDFEAVKGIAEQVEGPTIAGLARRICPPRSTPFSITHGCLALARLLFGLSSRWQM